MSKKRYVEFCDMDSADKIPCCMGMTGVEPAYHGLKARCIAVLLHTRMSHTGLEPVSED